MAEQVIFDKQRQRNFDAMRKWMETTGAAIGLMDGWNLQYVTGSRELAAMIDLTAS